MQKVPCVQFAARDHVAAEVKEHFEIAAFVGAVAEKLRVAREERFREEEEGHCEGDAGYDGADPVVPLPARGLAEESADCLRLLVFCLWRVSDWVGRMTYIRLRCGRRL